MCNLSRKFWPGGVLVRMLTAALERLRPKGSVVVSLARVNLLDPFLLGDRPAQQRVVVDEGVEVEHPELGPIVIIRGGHRILRLDVVHSAEAKQILAKLVLRDGGERLALHGRVAA